MAGQDGTETQGVEFEQIPLLLTDKDSIAFANAKSVPVMVDGDVVKTDSWDIAVYLDETYADAPSLLGGSIGQGVTRVINSWCDRAVNIALGPLIARDVLDAAHPDDRDYFRESMEKMYKRTLEEVQEGRDDRVINLYRTMDPIERLSGGARVSSAAIVPVTLITRSFRSFSGLE